MGQLIYKETITVKCNGLEYNETTLLFRIIKWLRKLMFSSKS